VASIREILTRMAPPSVGSPIQSDILSEVSGSKVSALTPPDSPESSDTLSTLSDSPSVSALTKKYSVA